MGQAFFLPSVLASVDTLATNRPIFPPLFPSRTVPNHPIPLATIHPSPSSTEKIFDRIPVYLLLLFLLEDERQFPPLKTLKAYVDSDALARVVEREEKREEKREESVVGRTGLANLAVVA